jgi:hypothetical protein
VLCLIDIRKRSAAKVTEACLLVAANQSAISALMRETVP